MDFQYLINDIGPLRVSPSPYDTAWLARLDGAIGQRALTWIKANQLPDGSWGSPPIVYHHDQVACTLAAMTTLLQAGVSPDSPAIKRATFAVSKAIQGLDSDHCGATVGFELIVPSLLSEAQALGVSIESPELDNLLWARSSKLSALPDRRIDRRHTPSFSAEAVGQDHLNILDADNLQAPNGSVSFSPSATAFFARYVKAGDEKALAYLKDVIDDNGAAPYVGPIEIFDRGWALWNLSLSPNLAAVLEDQIQAHVDCIVEEWTPGRGTAASVGLQLLDGDTTGIVFAALNRLGYDNLDVEGVLSFETAFCFRTYPLENDSSTSANIHILDGLRQVLPDTHSSVQKIIRFLRRTQTATSFWLDKWHTSPYYPTCHAVIALMGLEDSMVSDAVDWILHTQRERGGWGWRLPTAEETAYALQALVILKQRTDSLVPDKVLRRGYDWLMAHADEPNPPLWIGKSLYTPVVPVTAAVLSALQLVEDTLF
jgi:halimadienyl-diphosphate synthase